MNITIDRKVIEQALDALESIALAGMSGSGQESEEGMREWHARQAWKFIGIAARALSPLRGALNQPQQEPYGYLYEGTAEHTRSKTLFRKTPEPRLEARWWREVGPIYTSPQAAQPLTWQSIESMAVERYKVVPSHESMFYRHAVVAGNGMQQLFLGRETECANMARKFAGAFLDGAHAATKGTT